MDELIKRANQGPDSDEEPDEEPEPQDKSSDSEEEISILQSTDEQEQAADEDLLDTDGEPNTDTGQVEETTTGKEDTSDEEPVETPIETPESIKDTGKETSTSGKTEEKDDLSSNASNTGTETNERDKSPEDTDHGEKPSLEDEKIERLKDEASDEKDDENPYEASRERFKSLKQKEKEQFLKRDQAKSDKGSSDSLKDKYDNYGDGNVLH